MENTSQLGFALLGLLHKEPMSGYDLRKVFTTTAMGSFSDSPGAIYPALRRLETSGLVRGTVEESTSLRKRRVYKITSKGLGEFRDWLKRPVTRDDVVRRKDDLMLRFAFMDQAMGDARTVEFLSEFAEQVQSYLPDLRLFLESHAEAMPLSGRLALECGIAEYETLLRWARRSIATYEQRKGNEV
jgi:DNA-binding PadR family transcriptional regulator